MTSFRQFEANRRNALRSTGPRTEDGKRRSRMNAVRHGLTAETVVRGLEDAEDYKAFEATIIADYSAETAVARELVLRLASLLSRLRRATAIETDLLELHTEESEERKAHEGTSPDSHPLGCPFKGIGRLGLARNPVSGSWVTEEECATDEHQTEVCGQSDDDFARTTRHLTYSFLRLAKLDSDVFERLNR